MTRVQRAVSTIEGLKSARACKAFVRAAQPWMWSLTSPIACMKAYMVVGPTKLHPRFLRSLERAMDPGEVVMPLMFWGVICSGRVTVAGSNCQK